MGRSCCSGLAILGLGLACRLARGWPARPLPLRLGQSVRSHGCAEARTRHSCTPPPPPTPTPSVRNCSCTPCSFKKNKAKTLSSQLIKKKNVKLICRQTRRKPYNKTPWMTPTLVTGPSSPKHTDETMDDTLVKTSRPPTDAREKMA
jgi:hypothetical protein